MSITLKNPSFVFTCIIVFYSHSTLRLRKRKPYNYADPNDFSINYNSLNYLYFIWIIKNLVIKPETISINDEKK